MVRTASLFYFIDVAYLVLAICLLALGIGALWARTRTDYLLLPPLLALFLLSMPLIWLLISRYDTAWAILLFAWPFVLFGAASTIVWQQMPNLDARRRLYGAEMSGAVVGLALLGPLAISWLPVDALSGPGINTHLRVVVAKEGLRDQQSRTNAFARTDLVRTDRDTVAYVFTDAMFVTRAVHWDGLSPGFDDPHVEDLAKMKRFALLAGPRDSVLLLGAGAGFDISVALQHGTREIDAVEVNPQTISFALDLDQWAGGVMADPRVSLYIGEGRRFVTTSTKRWDHISVTLMQTSPATSRGRSHIDGRVLTVEALRSYLDHLEPKGVVAIIQNSPDLADRTFAALQEANGGDNSKILRFELTRNSDNENPFSHLLLARNELFTNDEVERLQQTASQLGIQRVSVAGPTLRPPTDDRPFMFEPGLRIHASALVATAVTTLILLILLVRERHHARTTCAAALAGLVAMALQILVMYRFQTAMGSPTLAMGFALASVLGGASFGVILLGQLIEGPHMKLVAGALALLGVLTFAVAGSLVATLCASLEPWLAGSLMVSFTVVCCLPLGLPFLALIHKAQQAGLVIGADGLGGVAGASLATMVSMLAGFNTTAWVLVTCLAIFCILAIRRDNPLASIQ